MLVGVDEVIVRAVVEEDKSEADRPACEAWTRPVDGGIRCPGEGTMRKSAQARKQVG